MNEWISSQTALPNLHPAIVHFPIVLVPLAAFLDLAAAAFERAVSWLSRAGTVVWALAGLGTGAAYWAGRSAADSLVGVAPQVQARIGEHSDSGLTTLWVVGVLTVLRLAAARWKVEHRGLLVAAGIAGLVASGLVARAADLGGSLVFEHAVAVSLPEPEPGSATAETSTSLPGDNGSLPGDDGARSYRSRLQETEAGGLAWRPAATDTAALGELLEPLAGADAVTAARPAGPENGEGLGLSLDVDGRALLVFPGTFGDVQVDAELALGAFDGTVALAHHVAGADRAGLFRVGLPGGSVALVTLRAEAEAQILDRAEAEIPAGPVLLGVYAAGRHLRGMIGGETVVHGHRPALPDGRVGLLLDGTGRVVVRSVTVTPIID